MKKDNKSFISILAKDYSLSITFFSTIIFFGLLGFFFDKYFDLKYILILGLFLGIIIGSYQIYNSIMKND
ncbi:MAG TPA: hypothetical protein EYO99_05225 [Candidatus Marinimicrobia bacterium]|jgi:F0F1-type ATP synthase assembly protein I|nr:hypothetical protein [Candidatus Neomarinimicrobiota bacterium]